MPVLAYLCCVVTKKNIDCRPKFVFLKYLSNSFYNMVKGSRLRPNPTIFSACATKFCVRSLVSDLRLCVLNAAPSESM